MKKTKILRAPTAFAIAWMSSVSTIGFVGCEQDTVDDAANVVSEAAQDAADTTKETAEEVADEIDDATDDK